MRSVRKGAWEPAGVWDLQDLLSRASFPRRNPRGYKIILVNPVKYEKKNINKLKKIKIIENAKLNQEMDLTGVNHDRHNC